MIYFLVILKYNKIADILFYSFIIFKIMKILLLTFIICFISLFNAQGIANSSSVNKDDMLQSFRFEGADIDTVMTQYCIWTGKTYLKTDDVQSSISLKVEKLTIKESIQVVEALLAMNGIALVPMGEKFIKVVQANSGDLVGQGMQIKIDDKNIFSSDEFVTTVIPLENVQVQEVQAAVQHILHSYGKILTLERSNSIMITDTASNVKRAKELVEFIDQATAQIEQRIYQINHAESSDIASKIEEIVDAAKGDEEKPEPTGNPYARTPAGVVRASANPAIPIQTSTQASIDSTEASNAVLIQGDVKILSDERTNILIIFSQSHNFTFFEKIIEVLDVAVDPEKIFEVINLEYSDAEELASTLNSLLGSGDNNSESKDIDIDNKSKENNINSSISNNINLSEETTILADIRSNSILIMGQKKDIIAIKQVIAKLDVKLEQVMIEAVIFEVDLTEEIKSGIDWLYRPDSSSFTKSGNITQGILSYSEIIPDITTEMIIEASSKDENVRVLSTPIIMTTDNTEAKLIVGEQRPVVTSTSTFGSSMGTQRSSYEYKDIGIELSVIPRINPQRVVVMEIKQAADQVGGTVNIDSNSVPVIKNREFEAQISVKDRETVALGGIITTRFVDDATKMPLLGDIPFIGKYLFGKTEKTEVQTELIILLTPYVLTSDSEIKKESEKRYIGSSMNEDDWPKNGWSESNLKQMNNKDLKVNNYIKAMKEISKNSFNSSEINHLDE